MRGSRPTACATVETLATNPTASDMHGRGAGADTDAWTPLIGAILCGHLWATRSSSWGVLLRGVHVTAMSCETVFPSPHMPNMQSVPRTWGVALLQGKRSTNRWRAKMTPTHPRQR